MHKDLGIHIKDDLRWSKHIEERLRKANTVLYLLRRNQAVQVKPLIKLGFYKSLILPVLLYGFTCIIPSRSELQNLERFQKKAVKWITGNKGVNYSSPLRLLNILPLPMFLQLNDLLLAKVMHESSHCIELPDLTSANGRKKEVFRIEKTRTEKARIEFTLRNCRLANRLEKYIEFSRPYGLKKRLINLMCELVNKRFCNKNVCTWQTFCNCHKQMDSILTMQRSNCQLKLKLTN